MDVSVNEKWIFNINFIKEKNEVTVSPKCNRIYVRRSFEKKLKYALDIKINPENSKELIIEEKTEQKKRKGFSSKRLIRKIADAVGTNENMHFYFIKEPESNRWRGMLLPELKKSYLWENMKKCTQYTYENDQNMIQLLIYFFRRYVEEDEILQFYEIAKNMVESMKIEGSMVKSYIWIYAVALLDQLRRAERRKFVVMSFDRIVRTGCRETFLDRLGLEDVHFKNLQIEEFIDTLTEREKYVLRNLVKRAESGEQTNYECSFVRKMWSVVCCLRKKANAYYDACVVKSYFA